MIPEVKISKQMLIIMATGSLVGLLAKLQIPIGPVKLLFEQSPMEWKRRNNGPDEIIVPEHLPMCLCMDIVTLTEMGWKVMVDEYEETPL